MRKRFLVSMGALLLCAGLGVAAGTDGDGAPEGMRAFPYPYRSMLAICSDIDGTTLREFEDYHKFLNTRDKSEMGAGLSLDVADSFWMYMANDGDDRADRDGNGNEAVMTYFQGTSDTPKDAERIAYYFARGWIDSMHSYGDFSRKNEKEPVFTRALAERAAAVLTERGLWPTVWINHGNAANTQNLENGSRKTYREGALPGSDAYHADITIPSGVKFVWFSENEGRFGRGDILYPVTLADGRKVWGFHRYTSDWSAYHLDKQLTGAHLDACVRRGLPVVVAQHLGGTDTYQPFGEKAREALIRLAQRQERGEILVARTSRLLEYLRARDHLVFETSGSAVNILGIDDPQLGFDARPALDSLRGMTFYVEDIASASISVNGEPLSEAVLVRAVDGDGRATAGIAWFEPDTENYIWEAPRAAEKR